MITVNRSWGLWKLDEDGPSLYLNHRGVELYRIDLNRIRNSADMLDWIFQVSNKTWATARVVSGLLDAFEDIFSPQANLCPSGKDKTLPAGFLRKVVN